MLAGCGGSEKEEVEKKEAAAPAPPTPQEIAAGIEKDLNLNGPIPAPGSKMPKKASDNFLGVVRAAKAANSSTPDGQQALQMVNRKLESRTRALVNNELWEHALVHIEAHKIFKPDSHKFDIDERRVTSQLSKPQVEIRGFFADGNTGQTVVWLDFNLPIQNETYSEKVLPGEEFYGLKLVGVIGRNQGVTMEHVETGDTYDVFTKSASRN